MMCLSHLRLRPWTGRTILALLLLGGLGCGSGLGTVRGRVVLKGTGRPLTAGLVVFEPLDEYVKVSARGEIQSDGTFQLGTYRNDDGAPPGRYRVMVVPPVPPNPDRRPPPLFHPRYERFQTSPLEYTISRGSNEFTIEVERP
jgi:hypothetical protein